MGEVLSRRREFSRDKLGQVVALLNEARGIAEDKACVYATGSFGREEAWSNSDLDLFIVGGEEDDRPCLSKLEAICLKRELIRATHAAGLPPFDSDGKWLEEATVEELVETLGRPEDDVANTFTARLLLLLESKALIGEELYDRCIEQVIDKYWRNYEGNEDEFMPAFLANDILRLWRTFCINYEAKTRDDPPEEKAKRKLKNYKLRHSRLLTCYSALAFMLARYARSFTFHREEAKEMVRLTATERLELLAEDAEPEASRAPLEAVLSKYERFLETTARPKSELIEEFANARRAEGLRREAKELGDAMFGALRALGGDSPFYRLLVV